MRSVRIVAGLAAVVCAFGVFTGAAFAKEKVKLFFGEFTASRVSGPINAEHPIQVKSKEGEVSELKIGPYSLKECHLSAKSNIDFERSRDYTTTLAFSKCKLIVKLESGFEEVKSVHFKLGVRFDANRSAELGKEGGFEIEKEAFVEFHATGSSCLVKIPAQFVPSKSGVNPEKEYEAAEYETEEEEVEGGKLKTYPSGFKDSVNIFMELKRIKSNVVLSPKCHWKEHEGAGEEEGKLNGKGEVELSNGKLEAELTELTASKGEFAFDEEEPAEV
jgi:hypothetical protein